MKSAIVDKVSRERIRHEIDLMLSGNQPAKALGYLSDFGLSSHHLQIASL